MATVQIINTSNLHVDTDVEVHSPDCQHLKLYARHPWFEPGFDEQFETPQQIFRMYNADFYAEEGNAGCWPIWVFPCTGLVKRKSVVRTWKDA